VVQGNLADDTVSSGLASKGWTVVRCDVYRTADAEISEADRTRAEGADAVIFASGSAVRNWTRTFGNTFGGAVVVIGPVTQGVAEEQGVHVAAVADEPTPVGIVRALSALFSQ
jgi:uroporphyrinogen-III synthase